MIKSFFQQVADDIHKEITERTKKNKMQLKIFMAVKIIHGLNNRYRQEINQEPTTQSKEAFKNHCKSVEKTIETYGCYPLDPVRSWERWKKCRLAEGWTYSPTYDAENKKHPNLVEHYHLLPESERTKDIIHWAAIEAATQMFDQFDTMIKDVQKNGETKKTLLLNEKDEFVGYL